MKFVVNRSTFAGALSSCARIIARKSGITILSHVLVEARDGHVFLRGTNLDMEVSFRVPADIDRDGSATILAEILDGFVGRVKTEVVMLDMTEETTVTVTAAHSRLTIPVLDAKSFPSFQAREPDVHFSMPGEELRSALEQCLFAVSNNPAHSPAMGGVCIDPSLTDEPSALHFAATDTHCLFVAKRSIPETAERLQEAIVLPKEAVIEVAKLAVADVAIAVSRGFIRFDFTNGSSLATKLIDGTFPDYRRVIRTGTESKSSVDSKQFAEAVDRVALTSDGKDRCIRIEFLDGVVMLEKRDATRGHATEEMLAETGCEIAFGMNSIYLGKSIKALASQSVDFFCSDPNRPILMRPTGQDNPVCMICPMRIAG